MIRPMTAAALMTLAAVSSLPQSAPLSARTWRAQDDIRWSYGEMGRDNSAGPRLAFFREGEDGLHHGTSDAAGLMGEEAIAALNSPGSAIAFTVAREAGTLACKGSVIAVRRAKGACRFTPDQQFAQRLAVKQLAPDDKNDLFGATLVDARLAQVEEMEREGYRFDEFGDVISVAALEVSAEFARSLRAAGLQFDSLDDLVGAKAVGVTADYVASLRSAGLTIDDPEDIVGAKAVGVEPEWLAGMAEVGYADLSTDQAIQLRAMDVTPEYAARMARVLAAVGE